MKPTKETSNTNKAYRKDTKKMKMSQDKAQEIIRAEYGENAEAIGQNENGEIITIFWIYAGEDEDAYKAHEVKA